MVGTQFLLHHNGFAKKKIFFKIIRCIVMKYTSIIVQSKINIVEDLS